MSGFLDALFVFVTTTFPKAGVQLGDLPLTMNLVLLALLLLTGLSTALKALEAFHGARPLFACLVIFGVASTLIAWQEGASLYSVAQRVTVMASPLAAVATFRLSTRRSFRIIACALVITSAYALVQFVGGVTATSVAGITYTMGQDLSFKPIGYTSDDSAAKIPSTYQNGSGLGIFDALAVTLMLVWHPRTARLRRLRVVAIVGGIVGLLLCGSRSIIIPMAASLVFVVHQYVATLSRRRQNSAMIAIIAGILAGAVYLTFFQSDILNTFWNRNAVHTINDPTASGRSEQWSNIWTGITSLAPRDLLRLILIGQDPSWRLGGEGLPEFFVTFGLPGTIAFYGGLLVVARGLWEVRMNRPVALGVLTVLIAFLVDQSFYYPPNVMNVYLVAILAFKANCANGEIPSPRERCALATYMDSARSSSGAHSRIWYSVEYLRRRQQLPNGFIQRMRGEQWVRRRLISQSSSGREAAARATVGARTCSLKSDASVLQSPLYGPSGAAFVRLLSRSRCCGT